MRAKSILAGLLATTLICSGAFAADLSIVSGDTGNGREFLRKQLDRFEKETGNKVKIVAMPANSSDQFGQYRLWLAAGNTDIDVYRTDVIWAPQLADQFLDLTEAMKDVVDQHFPSMIQSQTVDGKLVAMPMYTDAPAFYYRKDLLEKYKKPVPKTWDEMAATAKEIQEGERQAGNKSMYGFVFQGNAYEGLTCNALEWIKSSGGGQIIEPDGTISINNPEAVAAVDRAKGWIDTIYAKGCPCLYGRGEPRRLADGERRLHAQLALCLCAGQWPGQRDQGQVRCDDPPKLERGAEFCRDVGRLESCDLEIYKITGGSDQTGQIPGRA